MKLWEVYKALDENPEKVFEATLDFSSNIARMSVVRGISRYFRFEVFNGSVLIEQSNGGGAFNGNVALHLEWREVEHPTKED